MADKKVKLTAAQMKALAAYEFELRAAHEGHYLRSTGRTGRALLMQVYEKVTGEPFSRSVDSCGRCEYDLTAKVGKWYFENKETKK